MQENREIEGMIKKENVTIEDIVKITKQYDILLTKHQLNNILSEYNKVVMDNAEDWEIIIRKIIVIREMN